MIEQEILFPEYIQRKNIEGSIREAASKVLQDNKSRVILLYGPGGIGKTFMLHHMAKSTAETIWLEPIDVDDSEYWVLANLDRKIAQDLNHEGGYFGDYLENFSKLPRYERERIGHETVASHLRHSNEDFHHAYEMFIASTGKVPVIIIDTIETIWGTDLVLEMTQWMKRLPRTFFILAGRPPSEKEDQIAIELNDPHQRLDFDLLELSSFEQEDAIDYLSKGKIAGALSEDEKKKLALLTQGHPLWLALTVYYLDREGIPQEAKACEVEQLEAWLPYRGEPTMEGGKLQQDFYNRLLVPFRETDVEHDAIRRLAVLRRRVSSNVWMKLMKDRISSENTAELKDAWEKLLKAPWIRPRADNKYITLHDVLAEEMARRIIPLQDKDGEWRRELWNRAAQIYTELVSALDKEAQELDKELQAGIEALVQDIQTEKPPELQQRLVQLGAQLEVKKRELHQLTVTQCYYQLLSKFDDFIEPSQRLIDLFERITKEHDFRLGQLLWRELQRFLPGAISFDLLESIIRPVVDRFRIWFAEQPDIRFKLLSRVAEYLNHAGDHEKADTLLTDLYKEFSGEMEKEYELFILRGDARMRIPGRSTEAKDDFDRALKLTQIPHAPETIRKRRGEAFKELGFYRRHVGNWNEADDAYREAMKNTPPSDPVERAAIQSNWAYVEGLRGNYDEALGLIDSALKVRRRRKLDRGIAMALSVQGEIHRYKQDFPKAWESFKGAEDIFKGLGDWSWLGQIYQQQAICRFQEWEFKKHTSDQANSEDLLQQAQTLALRALDICYEWNRRAYPSALNRAARIFTNKNDLSRSIEYLDRSIEYLNDGIKWAKEMGDGWFWFANLIELAELSYHALIKTGDNEHLSRIQFLAKEIEEASEEYAFSDLQGRWRLIQGHIKLRDALSSINDDEISANLEQALEHYKRGFPLIARGFAGSHGARALEKEFVKFNELFAKLPRSERSKWCEEFHLAWVDPYSDYNIDPQRSDALHAHITEIYEDLVEEQEAKEASGQ